MDAYVITRDGDSHHGTIVDADAKGVWIDTDTEASEGTPTFVLWTRIHSIRRAS